MRNVFITLPLLVLLTLTAARVHAAPTPAKFPLTVKQHGITVTVTDASWVKDAADGWGLLVHYKVGGDATVAFRVSDQNTMCTFYDPAGEALPGTRPHLDSAFNANVSPRWKSVPLRFHVRDPKATTAQTEGVSTEMLTWKDISLQTSVPLRESRSTKLGTVLTLGIDPLPSPQYAVANAPQVKSAQRVSIAIRVDRLAPIRGLRERFDPCVMLDRVSMLLPMASDFALDPTVPAIAPFGICKTYVKYFDTDSPASPIKVFANVHESSPKFADPKTFRNVDFDLPLVSIPLPDVTSPGTQVAVAHTGAVTASVESFTADKLNNWSARVWINDPAGRRYRVSNCEINTDSNMDLTPYLLDYGPNNHESFWKNDGELPASGERESELTLLPRIGLPQGVRSLNLTTWAIADRLVTHRFRVKNIPVVAVGKSMDLDISASEIVDNPRLQTSSGDHSATITITKIERILGAGKAAPTKDELHVSYIIDNPAYQASSRDIRSDFIVDDHGRPLRTDNSVSVGDGPASAATGTYFIIDSPAAGAKSLDIDLMVTDTVVSGDPITLTFKGIPAPQPAAYR